MIRITRKKLIIVTLSLLVMIGAAFGFWYWRASRIWIGPRDIGVVIAHVGKEMPPGQSLARPGEKGVRETVLGPGLHNVDPFTESVQIFPIVMISAGTEELNAGGKYIPKTPPEVGIVTSLVGKPLKEGEFLANPGEQGVLRKVLVPGKYALNPYAFRVEKAPATIIDAGFVGVVTHLAGDPAQGDLAKPNERGVLEDPLPPGLYWLNRREYKVTYVKVGYHEIAFENENSISFPSVDGDTVKIDATVVWGIYPNDAPHIVKQFGTETDVIENAIKPQAESKARVAGSNYTSRQFVEGDSRERFQDEFFRKIRDELETKRIHVLQALVRNIEVPQTVRRPIQASKIAVEEEMTNRVKTETAKVLTELNEIRGVVEIEATKVRTETEKLALEEASRAQAEVARLAAETKVKISERQAEAARIQGDAKRVLGKAGAEILTRQSKDWSDGLRKRFEAFENPNDYTLWQLAENLPESLKIEIRDTPENSINGLDWVKTLGTLMQQSAPNIKKNQ